MKNLLVRLALILVLASISCSLPAAAVPQMPTPEAVVAQVEVIWEAQPGSTLTPTPFQPKGPTSTPVATATPAATDTPVLTPTSPGPTAFVPQNAATGTVKILVMGSDLRPGGGYRTDVMVLVTVNADAGTVTALSFPRDLYVTIPGWMDQRLNTAFPHGGFPMMADTLQANFGVRPDYYVLTNFNGFKRLIDDMNGIVVDIGTQLTDKCDLPQAVNTYCTVYPGPYEMDGETALWYVRSRHSSSDLDRTRRAQEVLIGIFNNLMSVDAISRLPELYDTYHQTIETNMSMDDIASLLPTASTVFNDPGRIRRYAIGAGQVYPYVTAEGAQVLLPNFGAIRQMIQEAVYTP
jgi:polyisoprenyl-teichoic acid--peptidoglycan teichoic acid transferase